MISDITDAFLTKLGAYATSKSLPVKKPGLSFDPPSDGQWLEVIGIPFDPVTYGLSSGTIESGAFRILVYSHVPCSVIPLQQTASGIAGEFKRGTVFDCATVTDHPAVGQMIEEPSGGKVFVPVTIRWRSSHDG